MTAPVIRWQYEGKTSGPRYEAWREEFGRWWVRADLIPILDDRDDCVASEITATPVNWKQGEDVIIAGWVSDDDAKKQYPQGWKAPKPYIRIMPQPRT